MSRKSQHWPSAVVFDLDGTLIDSAPDIANALNHTIGKRGLEPFPLTKVKEMIGGGVPTLIERARAAHQIPAHEFRHLLHDFTVSYRDNLTTQTKLYEGARELLEQLKSEGRLLGLCTNKDHAITLEILRQLDLAKYFSAALGEVEGRPRKPDPEPLREVLRIVGAPARDAVMVGDSEADISCARSAGVQSVAVSFGYSRTAERTLGADAVIDHLNDLPRCFLGLQRGIKFPA